jgi:AcrR family transcriptional regulator
MGGSAERSNAARSNAARSEAARERVLQAAFRALAANGYGGSSLASIAAAAGLTTPGLLHHFPSKKDLLVALLEERDRQGSLGTHLADAHGLEALDRLHTLAVENARRPELVRAFTVLLGESAGEEHPALEWARERYPKLRADLTAALARGADAGEIRADVDLAAVAAQVIAMMDGLQVQWVLNPGEVDMVGLLAGYFDGLRKLLRVPAGSGAPAVV